MEILYKELLKREQLTWPQMQMVTPVAARCPTNLAETRPTCAPDR